MFDAVYTERKTTTGKKSVLSVCCAGCERKMKKCTMLMLYRTRRNDIENKMGGEKTPKMQGVHCQSTGNK
jgi:hypothetical protein